MAVRACCPVKRDSIVGKIRVIVKVENNTTRCTYCGHINNGPHAFAADSKTGGPTWWLKRIPPLSELGDVETKETVDA